MTKTVDQWAAEACGVEFPDYLDDGWCIYEDTVILWTIKDPRCREILREHYKLRTDFDFDKTFPDWVCSYWIDLDDNPECTGYGKTIAEAECNCITAIYEAQK